jgi:DNA-binding transcriptional ArsR family regulator
MVESAGTDPRLLADVLRDPQDPRWASAFEFLLEEMESACRGHPRLGKLGGRERKTEIEGLTHDFWISLVENPTKLAFAATRGLAAVREELRRFLARTPGTSPDAGRFRLRKRLWTIVTLILGSGPPFRNVRRGVWWLEGRTPSRAVSEGLEDVAGTLGKIASRDAWRKVTRESAAERTSMREHLARVMGSLSRPVSVSELVALVWDTIDPHPTATFLLESHDVDDFAEHEGGEVGEPPLEASAFDTPTWNARVPVLASRVVDRLKDNVRTTILLTFRSEEEPLSLREVEKQYGVKKSTAENHVKKLREAILKETKGLELSSRNELQLVVAVLDILQNDHFSPGMGGDEGGMP